MGIIHITMDGEADKYCAGIVKYNNTSNSILIRKNYKRIYKIS